MSIRYLDLSGAVNFWTNIKNYILSKIPTKTSELTNDSGFLTQHQSLSNYVTLNSEQTITGKKLFTNATTKVNSVNTFNGSTQFIDLSTTVPRGSFPESAYRVGRVYIGDNTSYNGSWFIIDPTIDTDKAYYRMVTTNPDNTDSTRFSITWDSTKEGARRRRLACMGDLICATNNTYQIGESGNAWKDAYINNVHGISDYANLKTNSFNANTTLTHGGSGRRVILAMGAITLTVPAPEEGSWFLIKAVNGLVTLNLASNVTVTGITAGVFSGPIYLQPNESILLCYYSSTIYNATISTIRRSGVVGRTGNVPAKNPKHWFKIAENYVTATYRDPFICLRVFESTTGNTIGTLCAHCRINNTIGVVDTSNCYLQWQDAGSGIDLSKYALTTNETSGTGVTISLWCQLTGGYSSLKFEVVSECGQSDQLGNPEWVLTRRRQADGDLAELSDTDFTKIVYSTLTTLKNDTTGKASNVTGTVAIANGGTGATSRLSAIKNLTNESVGTPTHFLGLTTNYAKCGYTSIAQAKTVLGITGDMGSHSDSEYVHKTGDESITGTKTFGNGTLIVDNGIGSNVHGEIKFNGSRSGYIVADNAADGVFDNAGCGISILLQDSGKPLHIGAYKTDSNGRVFVDNTNKNSVLSITSGLIRTSTLIPDNDTGNSSFRILSQIDYANGDTSKLLDVRFVQYDNASASSVIFSNADGKTALGSTTKKWSGVYANNYYYGSDNVEFSTKFVTTDTTQTISGAKTFSSTITGSISGNASTATEFSANKDVTLTGDVTGTVSSKAGWAVSTTLANSGVTAGTYGPSADVTGSNNATILVPEITVDAKGRVTAITNRTYTSVNTDNDKRVHQYYKTDDNVYRLLWCYDAGNTSTSTLASKYTAMNNAFYVNPSTGALYATKLYSGGTEVLTSHQSLDNYVTLDSNQTITAIKTITGGNQGKMIFKNPNFTVGTTPESTTTVARIYFGGGASYDGSTGVITNDISSNGYSQLEICALNNNSSNSYRTSLILRYEQDQTRPRFIKSWGDFCPYYNDTYYLGRSDSVWKECYCNAYYLGTTAFGDIVTHNASEFLTSHQSLSSCVKNVVTNNQTIKSTGITRGTAPSSAQTFGIAFSDNNNKYIGNIYGQYATDKSTYVGLYAYKGTTTSNGDNAYIRVGYDASGNVYTSAPTPATTDNSTQIATTAFVKAQGYLTSHQSLANYVTTNTDQSISGIKSHSKHISILGDYVGNESSTNSRSCLYLKANRDTDGKSGLYVTKFRQNVAQGSMGSSDVVFLSHDILENETRTNAGFVESYSNWANDVPGGMSIYSTIATRNLGTSAKPWTNTYAVNFYENGTALSDKYALNENFGKGMTTYLYIKSADFPTGSSNKAIQYNDVVDGTKLYVWYSVCSSSSILDINPTATQVTGSTGQVWRYLGPTIYAAGLGHQGASPTGILGLFRRES